MNFIMLDGAMGTMLQKAGLPAGRSPELWNLENPEAITAIGRQYVEAGSDIIYANTFGANRHKLGNISVNDVVRAGIATAKEAVKGTSAKVALDIGPIGQLLEPLGTLGFDEAYDIFKEILIAGEAAGADLVVFETMSDLYEVKAGVLAAKENTSLPIFVTMTFEKNTRTFVGVTVPAMALTLDGLGVDAMGFNCSLGPDELLPMVKSLAEWTDKPIILKPNAGLPDPETGTYDITPEAFAETMAKAADYVTYFGGCCGTSPAFIAALRQSLAGKTPNRPKKSRHGVCSGTKEIELCGVRTIGERINPTGKKRFKQALLEHDISYILERGIEQEDAGADILDVNVGLPEIDEAATMKAVVTALQGVVSLPLQIDSSNIKAIEAGLRYYNGKPIVNSVNGDQKTLDTILPLCKKYGAAVVGLTMDEHGIPKTAEGRIAIAERIAKTAMAYGIAREDIYIDCLTLTASAVRSGAKETLKALHHVSKTMGLHTTLGVSNISFGLPCREALTVAFLTEAMAMGLDLPIVNPNQKTIMDAIFSHRALSGEDIACAAYIARFAAIEAPSAPTSDTQMSIETAIMRGLDKETAILTKKALESADEMTVIDTLLIPALDKVGEKYEKGEIFLPQLIGAATAACEGFEVIKTRLAEKGERTLSKGKILVATVKGDIHDIGKNIVKVVLENYGYTVRDLGKDVAPETIVETAIRENIHLIGLSALMTTTAPRMAETIALLRQSGHDAKVWVGGAVLSPEYAEKIGADFYAADAKQSVDIAKKVLT